MKGIKDRAKYQGVSLPVPLIEEIQDYVINSKKYRSIGEFVRESVREKLQVEKLMNKPLPDGYEKQIPPDVTEFRKKYRSAKTLNEKQDIIFELLTGKEK